MKALPGKAAIMLLAALFTAWIGNFA